MEIEIVDPFYELNKNVPNQLNKILFDMDTHSDEEIAAEVLAFVRNYRAEHVAISRKAGEW